MTITNGSYEPTSDPERTTREAFLATTFLEDFFDKFAQAEVLHDQAFLISVRDFDNWLVKMELLEPGSDDDEKIVTRGRGVVRQEVRTLINRGAEFGKTTWPPFVIKVNTKGHSYEVRLLVKHLETMSGDMVARIKTYLTNKHMKHWPSIRQLMYSEKVVQQCPELHLAFRENIEPKINAGLNALVGTISDMNQALITSAAEAQRALASLPRPPREQVYYITDAR